MNGAQAIVKTLIKNGTDVTFGYPGGVLIPLFDAYLEQEGKIKNVLVRHEQGAAHAAEGYARASGKVGVCIATSGPGATNLVTGIMDAFMDSVPIIAFGGQVSSNLIGNDAFQETDMMGITLPITKHNFQLRDANEAASLVNKAFKIALSGRPGPVYIDLPKDAQSNEATKPKTDDSIAGFQPTLVPNKNQIKKAAELILKSDRPLFLIGGGVVSSNASEELAKLVELTKIPVATTMMGKGAFDERHPLNLGVVGMHGRKTANYASVHTDLFISIGCRFSDRITGNLSSYADKAKVIHIDIDPAEIGKNVKVDIPIVGDAKLVIIGLINILSKKMGKKQEGEWTRELKKLRIQCDKCIKFKPSSLIHPKEILDEINKVLKEEDIIVTGVGQHQMFAMHYLKLSRPRKWISSGGAGTMGFCLPAAVGAKIARPTGNVFALDGDGSFQMTMQELGTIAQEGIKIMPIIFNNNYLGMVRQWLEIFFNKRYSQVHLGEGPDFVKMAESYKLKGVTISRKSEISRAIKEALKSDKTMIIDAKVEKESNILPMLSPGGHLKDAFGGCMKKPGEFF
jgi:acetolactate synthase-1/2/3 large subunit